MDMKISFDARKVLRAAERAPRGVKKYVRRALLESCRAIRETARERTTHKFLSKTGALERAISYRVERTVMEGIVYIDEKVAPYGKYVHEPTGIYGPKHRKYDIFPKNKKCLRWATFIGGEKEITPTSYANMRRGKYRRGSEFLFSKYVRHPGSKADQFLYNAAEKNRKKVNEILTKHLTEAFRYTGLE